MTQQGLAERNREKVWAAALIATNCTVQIVALGADTATLGSLAGLSNALTGAALVILARPSWQMLGASFLPVGILIAALTWAVWPDLTGSGKGDRIAPDLVAVDATQLAALIGLLVGAAMVGARRDWVWPALEALSAGGAACLGIGLVLRATEPNTVWGLPKGIFINRYTGTMLNANAMAAIHSAFAILALGIMLAQLRGGVFGALRHRAFRIPVYGGLAAAHLVACGITGSRTAFGALVVAASLLVWWYRWSLAQNRGRFSQFLAAVAMLAFALVASNLALAERLASVGDDWETRTLIWRHYADLAANAGPHGYGLGSFAEVNRAFLPDSKLATNLWYVNAAHNVVLQTALEGGVAYALLICLAVAIMAAQIGANLPRSYPARLVQLALVASCAATLTVGLDDIALNITAAATMTTSMWGLAWGRSLQNRQKRLILGRKGSQS